MILGIFIIYKKVLIEIKTYVKLTSNKLNYIKRELWCIYFFRIPAPQSLQKRVVLNLLLFLYLK